MRPPGLSADESIRWFGWIETDSGCWEWNGRRDRQGYGQIWFDGRTQKVPRLAYKTWVGPVADDILIRHLDCDNPPCINVAHMCPGTPLDNMRDKMVRGRHVSLYGEDSPLATRTESEIREIRLLYAAGGISYRSLGEKFDADPGYIGRIIRREIWSHVT